MDVKNTADRQSALLTWNLKTAEKTKKEAENQPHIHMGVGETLVVYNANSLPFFEKNSTTDLQF